MSDTHVDPTSRRRILAGIGGAAIGLGGGTTQADAAPRSQGTAGEPSHLAAERVKRRNRRRRIIYNNDGGDVGAPGAATPEAFLAKRLRPILGTQVDTIFYCTGATTMFSHLAQVGETYGEFCRDGTEGAPYRDNIRALRTAGHDVLRLATEFAHGHGLEIFFTHRINDIHDTFLDWELSRWKREHPEYLMGTRESAARAGDGNSPRYWWSALDFERPEALDYLCRIQEDVCARYDVDGVEIDYWRSPMFFRPNLDFQPATPSQIEILTRFQRRLRDISVRAGTRRGRPILMATRVPVTPAQCRHIGIDLPRWIAEGLTDLVTAGGGYVPFTEPLDEIVALAHRHGLPVYPTISASGMRGPENRYASLEAWRGAASNMWRAGADGILAFNLFPSGPEPRFQEIGSPETLAGRDKLFVIDPRRVLEGDLVQGAVQEQVLPLPVPPNGAATTRLPLGDDLPAAARAGKLHSAPLRVYLNRPAAVHDLEVRLNGAWLAPVERNPDTGRLTFAPGGTLYRTGPNNLTFRLHDAEPVQVVAVEVPVRYS